jgi:multiple sugar transport system ATP-binding protein
MTLGDEMADVSLHDVRKIYGSGAGAPIAVHGIDLHVADGEFLVLVGPSGCGKSTILRMIAGLESISAGELRIGGRRMNETAPGDRDIAMVFQTYALYPHMTVYENLAFALRLAKCATAELDRRVRAAASAMHIETMLPRYPRQLSGGERQRVALGRALVRQPKVFLFDEPLSNLDARLRVEMRREIARLHRELGTTMIYVTHDQVEAMTLGDRIVVLRDGRVQQVDTPGVLYATPATLFVAGFIGSPAMNIVRGTVRQRGDGLHITNERSLDVPVPHAWQAPLSRRIDRPVLVGIRPEHLTWHGTTDQGAHLTMRVEHIEHLGNESISHGHADDVAIAVRHGASVGAPSVGSTIPLSFDPDHVHCFDPETEQRIGE